MKISHFACVSFLVLVSMGFCLPAFAQLEEVPFQKSTYSKESARLKAAPQTTNFPFWDDFSQSNKYPNPDLWYDSKNVQIRADISIDPPTYRTASLDGADSLGLPYDTDPTINGPNDQLTSQLIDLSNLAPADEVYLSFYWQMKGHGEEPEARDSLNLQFKDASGQWKPVWSIQGQIVPDTDEFQQVLIKVNDASYFHEEFQFRFQSFGRQAGAVDNWNLDYIYLDKGRSATDKVHLDRALTNRPGGIFNGYYAIPAEHFFQQPENYVQGTEAGFYNLHTSDIPLFYSAYVTDLGSGAVIDSLNHIEPIRGLAAGQEKRTLSINSIDTNKLLADEDEESGKPRKRQLELTLYLWDSEDTYLESNGETHTHIDLSVNDTIRTVYSLEEYYAYDDGTAEMAAGIRQKNGKLAYQYVIPEGGYLTHIDINFAQSGRSNEGIPIELYVWESLADSIEPLHTQNVSVSLSDADQVHSYKLNKSILVKDTIYIGFRQSIDDFLYVGLDKNTNTGSRIYYNTTGSWLQNEKVEGSLLMRPRFSEKEEEILGSEMQPSPHLPVFPNPSNGLFFVEGKFQTLKVYNSQGRLVKVVEWQGQDTHSIDLSGEPGGIYLVWVNDGKRQYSERIVLRK